MDFKTVFLVVLLVCLAVFILVRYVFTPRTDHPWILLMVLLGLSAPVYHVYTHVLAAYTTFRPILDTPSLVCACFVLLALVGSVVGRWADRRRREELQVLPTSFRPSSQPGTWTQAQPQLFGTPQYPAWPSPNRYQANAVTPAVPRRHSHIPTPPPSSHSPAYGIDSTLSTQSGPTYGTFSSVTTPTTRMAPALKGPRNVSTPQSPTPPPAPALQTRKPLAPIQPQIEARRDGVRDVYGDVTDGNTLRKYADEAWNVFQKTRERAREVRELGHREEAKRQDKLADVRKAQMDKLNKAAAEAIFRVASICAPENNEGKGRSASEIDLHGLHVPEALDYTRRAIKKAKQQGLSTLKLIVGEHTSAINAIDLRTDIADYDSWTGKGNHSKNGEAKIKPAVQKMLKEQQRLFVPFTLRILSPEIENMPVNNIPPLDLRLGDPHHSASTPGPDPIHELNALTDQVSRAQNAIAGLFHRLSAEKDEIARTAERQKADRAQSEALLNHLDVFCGQQRAAEQTVRLLLQERDARDAAFKESVMGMFEEKARKDSEMQKEVDGLLRNGLEGLSTLEGLVEKFRDADRSEKVPNASPSPGTPPMAVDNLEVVSTATCNATASSPISSTTDGTAAVMTALVSGYAPTENRQPSTASPIVVSGWDLCEDHVKAASPDPPEVSNSAVGGSEGMQQSQALDTHAESTGHKDIDESLPIPKLKLVDTKRVAVKKAGSLRTLKKKKLEYATTRVTVERIWVGYAGSESHVHMLVKAFDEVDDVSPLEDLMRDLQVYHQDAPPLAQSSIPYTGQFVSAIFAGRWFRAVICSVSELKREAEVELVDYGDKITAAFQHIRLLPTKFRTMASQTTEARLSYVKPLECENPRNVKALMRLSALCGRTFSATGLYSSDSIPYIRLRDSSCEEDENAALVREGLVYYAEGPVLLGSLVQHGDLLSWWWIRADHPPQYWKMPWRSAIFRLRDPRRLEIVMIPRAAIIFVDSPSSPYTRQRRTYPVLWNRRLGCAACASPSENLPVLSCLYKPSGADDQPHTTTSTMSSPTSSFFSRIASAVRTGFEHVQAIYASLVSPQPPVKEQQPPAPEHGKIGAPETEWNVRAGDSAGTELRNRAQEAYKLMREEREKAREARVAGNRSDAQLHNRLADERRVQAEKLNKDAAEVLYRGKHKSSSLFVASRARTDLYTNAPVLENNEGKNRSASEADLHDLYVEEALDFAKRAIDKARQEGLASVKLIVGKGNRSKNGEAKIKPRVQDMLDE
ncbi:hypothetical protein EVG20_g4248 [Dentipellis fragilis]|uniref:Smr domain-containing protein n=1 Tax=Dentipellis fragilis TaxID=205917 RepID=A0A4Y9YWZ7_9AGAM|nr:hypothetical protein EVG20_g4248 [Dentipellis fragilis]